MNSQRTFKGTFLLSAIVFMLANLTLFGQDSHYYSQQADSRGNFNGGTGTAGSREVSAIFYNPGIIALFDQSNVGISGSLYSFDFVNIKQGGGSDRDLRGSNFQVIPSLLAGTKKWKKNKKFTTSFAYLNTGYYSNRLSQQYKDSYSENGQSFEALNRYEIHTRFTEDWFGAGISYRINEHWGIGLVPFVHVYSIQYMQHSYLDVFNSDDLDKINFGIDDYRNARIFSPAILLNVGLVYHKNGHEIGLTIITPRINVSSLGYSSVERTLTSYSADSGVDRSVLVDPEFRSFLKRPLEINLGYAYLHDKNAFKIRITYYSKINPYVMGYESSESARYGYYTKSNKYDHLPVTSNSAIINAGIGYEWNLRKDLRFIVGARTDFTFFDKSSFKYVDFTTVLVHWNLWHLSCGFDFEFKKLKLNTGIDYGFSYDKNISQFINLDDLDKPLDQMNLSNMASVNYQQIKLFLGLVISLNKNSL